MEKPPSEKDLFGEDLSPQWKTQWVGMPEFVQEKQRAYAQVIFRFNSEEDLQEFSKLIGQKLTQKTKSAWHPQLNRSIQNKKVYKSEA